MATSQAYVDHLLDLLVDSGAVRARRMFGEYMVYVDDKPLLLVCDNCVFVKALPQLSPLLGDAPLAPPYPGARDHYMVDVDRQGLLRQVVEVLLPLIPVPRPRKRK